eukprot:CAMPEP_0171250926 /NCGR_PEP_ID=MMETSP0790-20130122/50365_1 /TAXON_ID=2925 /ORGANISM="Alexandrium catenella, Strain OF101" /LENGTH=339 /DNA_ID=CAMNT_0011718587 /DNA_START=51 /DNA_END=1067 /DNA_ORIENTATION=-
MTESQQACKQACMRGVLALARRPQGLSDQSTALLWLVLDDLAGAVEARSEPRQRVGVRLGPQKGPRIGDGAAPELAVVPQDHPDLPAAQLQPKSFRCTPRHLRTQLALEEAEVRRQRLAAKMPGVAYDGVARVAWVRELGAVHDHGVLQLSAQHDTIPYDDVSADVGTKTDSRASTNDGRTGNVHPWLNNGASAYQTAAVAQVEGSAQHLSTTLEMKPPRAEPADAPRPMTASGENAASSTPPSTTTGGASPTILTPVGNLQTPGGEGDLVHVSSSQFTAVGVDASKNLHDIMRGRQQLAVGEGVRLQVKVELWLQAPRHLLSRQALELHAALCRPPPT